MNIKVREYEGLDWSMICTKIKQSDVFVPN